MHIGVDVRNLTVPAITGIGRVLVETARALSERGVSFTFYWPANRHPSPLDAIAAANHVTSAFSGGPGRVVWGETALPLAVRKAPPDVFWGPAHRLPPFLPASVPALVTIHDLVWHRYPETMTIGRRLADQVLMRAAVARADFIAADSHATAHDVKAVLGRDAKVIYPGASYTAPTDCLDLFSRLDLQDGPYALFVGTLEPRKNLVGLLEAFSRARRAACADWRLVIAGGDGWRDSAIRQALDPLLAAGHVRLAGRVDDPELANLYAGARFLAFPSLYEGFGLPVVEAQQYGVPVLASNRGSLPEVTGAGGLLVDPLDIGEMAQGIHVLFTSDEIHDRLAAAARENARRFSWDAAANRMLSLFQAVRRRQVLK
ncbi:glycosyltransferase family 4 protein [Oricola cellulosilytica]|uniref:Glycosyltransferase family 1 protein n=1 Tax=Oricola cellulosilytica TaxID=1429082 RepID=A0A4R0P988_9HYPH|nr:glycosyltransferase family 1 protein [Oricola cellulosilytica]TCD11307.1 glycosyltransferase family 1 protein [Oricola cellulosilytica]